MYQSKRYLYLIRIFLHSRLLTNLLQINPLRMRYGLKKTPFPEKSGMRMRPIGPVGVGGPEVTPGDMCRASSYQKGREEGSFFGWKCGTARGK